ncbi:prephenate dehydrogenase/arogenate dehydrogenase family protein [Bifidobacterium avesanii]|uniref:Prephenate dehydrogenase/arogenate dehydrogenase family protein n=2 Tax=Bifidobacterium avesanii TaxID=1798157 RepID=A0A7K3TKT0_9BIFI|nr:prephenate dehydrogenase/arogenate dehydrogenase family protein [Bifidobacterium avesanii]NEG79339.1 prephenate dehydrogenase/arogenate dehydrogenase family protein [Bifidobacterium avesanii]
MTGNGVTGNGVQGGSRNGGPQNGVPRAATVGVVGLGLIGGSLALRLVERGRTVVAWNHTPRPYDSARAAGVRCVDSLEELAAAGPDVIVLCNPLKAMPDVLGVLAGTIRPGTTLTDVGSVKGMVRDQVKAAGLDAQYVGAHPMAGNERSGWAAADPTLYDGALWAVTVDGETDYARFLTVMDLITAGVGNRVIVLNDAVHDEAAALISHMPHVVATALANELTADPNRNVAAALAAGCWRDMTRVALTDPDRTRAMVEEDAANVETLLRSMAARLTAVADLLHGELASAGVDAGAGACAGTGSGDGSDCGSAPVAATVTGAAVATPPAMLNFFAAADPFRAYKAAERAGTAAHEPRVVDVTPDGWRDELLASARRGEHVVRIDGLRRFAAEVRSAL